MLGMLTVHELQLGTAGHLESEGRVRARRRWVLRTSATLLVSAVLLVLLVTWRRDEMSVARHMKTLDTPVKVLRGKLASLGTLPAVLPELSGYYASDSERFYALRAGEPVIIAYQRPEHLILRENGLGVIIYDKGQVTSKWMSASEFAARWRAQLLHMKQFDEKRLSEPLNLP